MGIPIAFQGEMSIGTYLGIKNLCLINEINLNVLGYLHFSIIASTMYCAVNGIEKQALIECIVFLTTRSSFTQVPTMFCY